MKLPPLPILFILVTLGFTVVGYSQSIGIDTSRRYLEIEGNFNGAEVNLPVVKKLPEYPGGKKAWQDFLRSNINIAVPISNKARLGVYRVMIRFVVGSDGKLRGIGADSNCGFGMENEIIRCLKKSPDWIPAESSSDGKVGFTLRTIVIFNVKQNDVVISFP